MLPLSLSVPIKLQIYRIWWWIRPRIFYVIPATFGCVLLIQLLATLAVYSGIWSSDNNTVNSLPTYTPIRNSDGTISLVDTLSLRVAHEVNTYNSALGVAFAIPVGGRTQRSASLQSIIKQLLDGGARADHIFVFEDVQSRINSRPDPNVASVVEALNVRIIHSNIRRDAAETAENFGIHLARHYKFMMDFLLAPDEDHSQQALRLKFLGQPPIDTNIDDANNNKNSKVYFF